MTGQKEVGIELDALDGIISADPTAPLGREKPLFGEDDGQTGPS